MSKTWGTASALERIHSCPASAVLPQTRSISSYSKNGHGDHEALEAACKPGTEKVTMPSGHVIDVEALLLPEESQPEVAFSYDVVRDMVSYHGTLKDSRGYPDSPYSTIHGTADVVGFSTIFLGESIVDATRSVDIVDYKTGSVIHEPDSWQMRILAFMAARYYGTTVARTRITRVRDGFIIHSDWKLWSGEEIEDTAGLLRKLYDSVQKAGWKRNELGLGDVTTGPHCHFCPAFLACPAQKALIAGQCHSPGEISQSNASDAYNYWQRLRTLASKMEESLKYLAASGPIDLGGGYRWGRAHEGASYRKYKERLQSD